MIDLWNTPVTADNHSDLYTLIQHTFHTEDANMPLAAKVGQRVVSLRYIPKDGDKITPLYLKQQDGFRAYRQSIMFVFMLAVHRVYPSWRVCLRRSMNKATYCEVVEGVIEEGYAQKVKEEMNRIIAKNDVICSTVMSTEEAAAFYENQGKTEHACAAEVYEKDQLVFYSIDDYKIYLRGQLTYKTGQVPEFELCEFEHGFMLSYPNFQGDGKMSRAVQSRRLIHVIGEYRVWGDVLGIHNVADLNMAIHRGKTQDLIHMQESFHEKKIASIANCIKEAFPQKRLVLIAGPSSSGKTTFSKRLNIHLRINGLKPINISLDDYYKPAGEIPKGEDGKPDLETVEAIDYRLFSHQLRELIDGKEVTLPRFDFMQGKRVEGDTLQLSQGEVIIVEGIHALNEKISFSIAESNKYKIYITPLIDLQFDDANPVSPTDLRLLRRIVRDMQFRRMGGEGTLAMWQSVRRGELSYIFPFEEQANTVFNSSFVYEFSVLKAYAWDELAKISCDSPQYSEAQRLLDVLSHFVYMNDQTIPTFSLLREFIGGSSF